MPSPPVLTLEQLFAFLPDLEEVEELRLRVIGAAVPDPAREWASSRASSTIDKRVVAREHVEEAMRESEAMLVQHVVDVFAALRPVLDALWADRPNDAARHLVAVGERHEQAGRFRKARECFQTALAVTLPLAAKDVQILALRRIARVSLALGEIPSALLHYRRSHVLARDAGDLEGEVIARTGYGNALAVQGRWVEAESVYRDALARIDGAGGEGAFRLQRAQLLNNLGAMAMRQSAFAEADGWFEEALTLWEVESSPTDLAICHHSRAQLRERQGRGEEARDLYRRALALPVPPAVRATVAIDLAECHLRDGQLGPAEEWGREAEQHAIASHSPYYLAHMYRGLGNIARATAADDGFTFFEKALEISRSKSYRLVEGETLVDYAAMRAQMGETEEAHAYLERALELFDEIGALHERSRAEEALHALITATEAV